jgi:transcription elongation factor S-II
MKVRILSSKERPRVAIFVSKADHCFHDLALRWKEGEFTLDAIGSWSAYDLQPAYWKDLKDQQLRREQRILEGNLSMATDRFRCSGCKKKMCSYYELQTRSADEPMTIFIRCLNCGKQWKQ